MAERQRLSVVVLTKNEEPRIARCLSSVRWADELIVVDGMSEDRTVEICRQFGARVIPHAFEGSFAQERNLGMERATGEWVLQIDADDVVTPAFREAVQRLLERPQPHAVFKFRRKSYLLGRFMRHGGWYHELPNLVRRDAVRYEGVVHERPVARGTIGRLDADIEHHPCNSLAAFLDRHNRYTSLHAQELVASLGRLDEREIRSRLIRRPWKTWWKSYVKKQGFREGLHGLVFSIFFAGVELIKWAKYWEYSRPADSGNPGQAADAFPASLTAIKVHYAPDVHGPIEHIEADVEHYPFQSLTQFIERQNRSTSMGAQELAEQRDRPRTRELVYHLVWRPVKLFWKSYIRNRGYQEGLHGLVFSLLWAFVHVMLWAKYWEQRRGGHDAC
ncbi:MAG: glycosyltransferase family 2 protein [Candidatus Omnitrophica bacterium]|nr:glycosyltransferase family 2 protein [Candidatus Omnitrophota bacterium]